MEIWRDIAEWKGIYQISNEGRVRSLDRIIYKINSQGYESPHKMKGKILKQCITVLGYPLVKFSAKGRPHITVSVHTLVAKSFVKGFKSGLQVCHKDGSKTNNKSSNLRWGTISSNGLDRHFHGTIKTKLNKPKVKWIRANKNKLSANSMAIKLGVHPSSVSRVIINKTWRHIK